MNKPPEVSSVEKMIIYGFSGLVDGVKFITGLIPIVDLLGSGLAIGSYFALSVYFLIRLGPEAFLGGRKGARKLGFFIADTITDAIPEIDDLLPTLTPLAWNTFACIAEEQKEYQATNDNIQNQAKRAA